MTTPTDLDGYEKRVAAATERLADFYAQLVGELDEQNGAFPWWSGHSDWKTLTLLADYLLQSVQGAEDALLSASLAAQVHRQMVFAEGEALRAASSAVAKSGKTDAESFIAATPRDAQARRRARTITSSAEECFFHLGQTLDRLGVAAIIVGGFEVSKVTGLYWSTLQQIADSLNAGNPTNPVLQPAGTAGRTAQEALVAPVLGWHQFGAPDWLPWMRDTRNLVTHRGTGTKFIVAAGKQLTRLFYKQPKWSELQSLVFGGKPPKKPFFDSFISCASADILEGLCDSTTKLVEALVLSMVTCWNARKANSAMIVQHGTQWPVIEPTQGISAFPGYGANLQPSGDKLVMNPLDAQRWTAARAADARLADWY
jgi:hypothetical protein